jgi:hypothetical protein
MLSDLEMSARTGSGRLERLQMTADILLVFDVPEPGWVAFRVLRDPSDGEFLRWLAVEATAPVACRTLDDRTFAVPRDDADFLYEQLLLNGLAVGSPTGDVIHVGRIVARHDRA